MVNDILLLYLLGYILTFIILLLHMFFVYRRVEITVFGILWSLASWISLLVLIMAFFIDMCDEYVRNGLYYGVKSDDVILDLTPKRWR